MRHDASNFRCVETRSAVRICNGVRLSNRTPAVHQWALDQFKSFRSEGQFVPLGLDKQTVVFPGFDGGAEWGGPAFDPETGLIYINANEMAWTSDLAKNDHVKTARSSVDP